MSNESKNSCFDGKLSQWIGWSLLGTLVTLITIGLGYPWAVCKMYGWKIKHTTIEGRRLKFTGSAGSLFGLWIKWILLTIITIGIYSFWIPISLEKWRIKHTQFADEETNNSSETSNNSENNTEAETSNVNENNITPTQHKLVSNISAEELKEMEDHQREFVNSQGTKSIITFWIVILIIFVVFILSLCL